MKHIFFLAATLSLAAACTPALANKHNLVTSDCGVNWRTIPAGSSLPEGAVDKGDILITKAEGPLNIATVVDVNTKSLAATTELKSTFGCKLKTEAL